MDTLRMLRLFASLMWRKYEPRSCGIPDPYRCCYRLTPADAWGIARTVFS